MTVENTACSISYAGNDVRTEFPTTFRFLEEEHLVVETSDDDGDTWDTLVLGDDYEVDGAGDDEPGGTVTTDDPVATGTTLRITRETPRTQLNSFQTTGPLPAATIETSLDKTMMCLQEQDERLEALEALEDLVTVSELADAVTVNDEIATDDVEVEDTFPVELACAGGENATYAIFRVWKDGDEDIPFDEPPAVQWKPGPTNKITIVRISGLEPGAVLYQIRGLVFVS